MKHSVRHDLGQQRARKVAESAFASYREKFAKYEPKATWVSEHRAEISFVIKGFTLKGSMEVLADSIDMDLEVPLLLRPFRGTALGYIEAEINEWIKKAQAGEI